MKLRSFLAFTIVAGITLAQAATIKSLTIKTSAVFMPPSDNIVLQIKDGGANNFALFGNSNPGGVPTPFKSVLNRSLIGNSGAFPGMQGDLVSKFMDYTDDACMAFQTTLPNGRQGIGVARYRPDGTQVYRSVREINTFAGTEKVLDAGIDAAGNIYVLGEAQSSATAGSLFLTRFNANGSASWVRSWYQNRAVGLIVYPDGTTEVSKLGNFEIQIFKITPTAGTLSTRTLVTGVDMNSPTTHAYERGSGFVFHTITWTLLGGTTHTWIEKRDNLGVSLWSNTFNGAPGRALNSTLARTSNGVVLCQSKASGGVADVLLTKVDTDGNQLWQQPISLGVLANDMPTVTAMTDPYDELYLMVSSVVNRTRFSKIAPNGTQRWQLWLYTPGANAIQRSALTSLTDILVSSYSFGATQTGGSFLLQSFQQSAVALNDAYNVTKNVVNTPSRSVGANDRYAASSTITTTQPSHGTLQMYSNGIFKYTPTTGYVGPDSFQYTLSKPGLDSSTATVNLNVR